MKTHEVRIIDINFRSYPVVLHELLNKAKAGESWLVEHFHEWNEREKQKTTKSKNLFEAFVFNNSKRV